MASHHCLVFTQITLGGLCWYKITLVEGRTMQGICEPECNMHKLCSTTENSLANQPTSTQGGKGLVNRVFKSCLTALDIASQSEDSIRLCDTLPPPTPILLTTKCEIDNNIDCYSVNGELCIKKNEDLKKEQVLLLSETVKEKDVFQLLCQLGRLRQNAFAMNVCLLEFFNRSRDFKMASS